MMFLNKGLGGKNYFASIDKLSNFFFLILHIIPTKLI